MLTSSLNRQKIRNILDIVNVVKSEVTEGLRKKDASACFFGELGGRWKYWKRSRSGELWGCGWKIGVSKMANEWNI